MLPVSSIQQTGAILRTTFVMSNTFETGSVRYTLAHLTKLELQSLFANRPTS